MKTVVISHWDLDGLASAVIASMKFKPIKIFLASVTATPKYIHEAIKIIGRNGVIWVTDLNPQPNHIAMLNELFKLGRERKIQINWIDHHSWDRKVYDMFMKHSRNVWYLVDTETVTADLVARKLGLADNEYVRRLVDLAIDDDFFLNRYELTIMWRRVLRWYKWPTRYKALDSLIKGEIRPRWLEELYYREVKNIYENLIREAIARSDVITTKNNIKIIVFQDVDPRVHPGEITMIAKQNGLIADIYVVRYPRGTSLRSSVYDVSVIAKKLGGGGHKNAAGIPGNIGLKNVIELIDHINVFNTKNKENPIVM